VGRSSYILKVRATKGHKDFPQLLLGSCVTEYRHVLSSDISFTGKPMILGGLRVSISWIA